jgi:acetyl-CoA decarbonylase/synthase complex subunit gamma
MMSWFLLIPALSAFLAMNFTGASTYTSLSGVRKEMRWALPLEIGGGIVGLALWVGSHFIGKGV